MLLLMIAVSPLATLCLTIFLLAVESFNLCILFKGLYEVRIFPYMLTGLLAMIACFIQRTRCRQAFDGTPLTKIFLMVVVLEAISILWSPVPGIGVYLSLLLGVHLLMLIAIVNIMNSKKAVQTVVLTWIWGAAVVSVCVFVSRWVEVRWEWTLTDVVFLRAGMGKQAFRPAGVGGAINIGGYLATSLMIVMGQILWEKTWRRRALYCALFLLMLCSLIQTFSRGGVISLFGAFAFFIVLYAPLRKHVVKLMVLLTVVTSLTIFLTNPGLIDRVLVGLGYQGELYFSSAAGTLTKSQSELLESGEGLSGFDIRMLWWKNALGEMNNHPVKYLSGLGIGGFIYYSQFFDTVSSPEVNSYHFSFFYDVGIIGIFLYLAMVVMLIVYLYRGIQAAAQRDQYLYTMLIASCAGMVADTVIYGLIDNDLTSYGAKYLWVPVALCLAIARLALRSENPTECAGKVQSCE